jgi:serine/threonine-protein kinase RsbW
MNRTKPPDLQQNYPAVAESIATARHALGRFAAEIGARPDQVEAVRLAASEAVTNVVKHAYPDHGGSVHISAAVACDELCVLIGDEGCGIRPHLPRAGLGLGLTLMAALCDELQILKHSSGGTELWLWFALKTSALTSEGQPRGLVASATAPAKRRFSTTNQPAPETTTVSSAGTS